MPSMASSMEKRGGFYRRCLLVHMPLGVTLALLFGANASAQPQSKASAASTWIVTSRPRLSPWHLPEDVESILVNAKGQVIMRKPGWWYAGRNPDGLGSQRQHLRLELRAQSDKPCTRCAMPPEACVMLRLHAKAATGAAHDMFARDTGLADFVLKSMSISVLAQLGEHIWMRERRVGQNCQGQAQIRETLIEWNKTPTKHALVLKTWWAEHRTRYEKALLDAYRRDHVGPQHSKRAYRQDELKPMIKTADALGLPTWKADAEPAWQLVVRVPEPASLARSHEQDWIGTITIDEPNLADFINASLNLSDSVKAYVKTLIQNDKREIVGLSAFHATPLTRRR